MDQVQHFGTQHMVVAAEFTCAVPLSLNNSNSSRRKPCTHALTVKVTDWDKYDHEALDQISPLDSVAWFEKALQIAESCKSEKRIPMVVEKHSFPGW